MDRRGAAKYKHLKVKKEPGLIILLWLSCHLYFTVFLPPPRNNLSYSSLVDSNTDKGKRKHFYNYITIHRLIPCFQCHLKINYGTHGPFWMITDCLTSRLVLNVT